MCAETVQKNIPLTLCTAEEKNKEQGHEGYSVQVSGLSVKRLLISKIKLLDIAIWLQCCSVEVHKQ